VSPGSPVNEDARTLWDYHHVRHSVGPAEVIVVLGSHDTRVAERGADLFLQGLAPLIVFSGNVGALTRGLWDRPEAEVFAEVARDRGVPAERILIEPRATNTGENVVFTRRLLEERGPLPRTALAVQKPYMERRTLATFGTRWREIDVRVTSPQVDYDDYPTGQISRDDVIHIMVGDFQRLLVYAERGWQTPQEIPDDVRAAYERLVAAGYTRHLINDGR
jgi:uncharacterized SAM-binding protein YcdF (DUF218 family)